MHVAWRWLALISLSAGCGRIGFETVEAIGEPRTCRDANLLQLPTGVYTLAGRDVWCEQDLRGGGWTLALAVDGAQPTFLARQPLWEDSTLLNATSLDPAGGGEAKLAPYLDEPLAELMLEGGSSAVMRIRGTSLHALIASGLTFPSMTSESELRTAFPPGDVQSGCRRQGIGLTNEPTGGVPHELRIGVLANNEVTDCNTPDSFIGVGGEIACANGSDVAAGNVNKLGPTGTCAPRRVLVYVRGDDQTRFASLPSCADHLARGRTEDGVYLVNGVPRRCDMTTDGGGWTNAYDFDGVRDPCPSPWTSDPLEPRVCIVPGTTDTTASISIANPIATYRDVMTTVTGYQRGSSDGFQPDMETIDSVYVDGLSVTTASPRQHVATFASGYGEDSGCGASLDMCNCPCVGGSAAASFIAAGGYRCEAGSRGMPQSAMLSRPDPLFDGMDVAATSCAAEASAEPIRTTLAAPTSSDLEARLMRDEPLQAEGLGVYRFAVWVR